MSKAENSKTVSKPETATVITIESGGAVRFLYTDELRGLLRDGDSTVTRASYVEPQGTDWTSNLSPVQGPVLGPFETRAQALQEEVQWLYCHRL